jgi:Putative auto-transporter adhesin, head GIN domain
MRKFKILTLMSVLGIFIGANAFAQNSETRPMSSFNEISLSGIGDITLKQGNQESVKIEVDNIDLDDIITEVKNNRLKIRYRDNLKFRNQVEVKIEITYKSIQRLDLSGAVSLKSESTIQSTDFKIDASGAGNVNLKLNASKLYVHASGAGNILIEGKVDSQYVELSGAGSFKAFNLVSQKADLELSGASTANIQVQQSLSAQVSGASSVRFKGDPTSRNINKSGVGSVKQVQ